MKVRDGSFQLRYKVEEEHLGVFQGEENQHATGLEAGGNLVSSKD